MAKLAPVATDRAEVELIFDLGGKEVDVGIICTGFRFRAMVNGGYMISGRLADANFNITKKLLIDAEYLLRARSNVFRCRFRLKWPGADNATVLQTAHITSLRATGTDADKADLEFMGIDPPSWFLNTGDSSGRAYRGKVSSVISQVIADYAPGITATVSETTDSDANTFWMMRMDPKTFITSLMDWSSSLTRNKTQWFIGVNNNTMYVKEQADIKSENVGFYMGPHGGKEAAVIRQWELLGENAMSIMNSKLVTQGISAVSGQFVDRVTDAAQAIAYVKDSNTPKKYKAKVDASKSYTAPPDGGPQRVGWTVVPAIPELYSAGDIGRRYSDYLDGRARALWLHVINMTMRCRFRTIGHGTYSSSLGLGTNTVTVQWLDVDGKPFLLSGNWIVYGFEHIYVTSMWQTDIYCARLDHDAVAVPVP